MAIVPVTLCAQAKAAPDGWNLLSQFLYRDAAEAFQHDRTGGRVRDLGLAAALLNEPPITQGKITLAEELLRGVAADTDDDITWYARYLLARILHVHREAPVVDVEAAYRAIITGAPDSAAAQLSAAQLALLLLYQRPDLAVPARIEAAAALQSTAGNPRLPDIAATYYQQLANAAMFYRITNEDVLGWLERAHTIGLSSELDQSTLNLQIAETARALDRRDLALDYYQRFLTSAVPTDQRYHTAEWRMAQLKQEGAR